MDKYLKLLSIPFCLLILVGGCLSASHPGNRIQYYMLEYKPAVKTDLAELPFVIRVERFTVAPLYNSDKIVYEQKRYRRDTYNYHKWRANPGDLATYFLTRDLQHASLFKAVFSFDSMFPSTHEIEGTVDEFFELDEKDDTWKAVLHITLTLMTENEPDISKKVLFQKQYREVEPCKRKNPAALAEAMSIAMSRLSEKTISDIYQELSNQLIQGVDTNERHN